MPYYEIYHVPIWNVVMRVFCWFIGHKVIMREIEPGKCLVMCLRCEAELNLADE